MAACTHYTTCKAVMQCVHSSMLCAFCTALYAIFSPRRVCEHIKCYCAYAHIINHAACALQFACCGLCCGLCCSLCCGLCYGLCCGLRQSMPQAAARKLQRAGRIVFHVCERAIAFMFIHTHSRQHASEIAGNSVALLVEIQRKLKYVQLGAACGPRPAACGKV